MNLVHGGEHTPSREFGKVLTDMEELLIEQGIPETVATEFVDRLEVEIDDLLDMDVEEIPENDADDAPE